MNETHLAIPHYTFDAVVSFSDQKLNGLRVVTVYTRDETYVGWTWLAPLPSDETCVHTARVTMVPTGDSSNPLYIVAEAKVRSDLDVFDLIPDSFGRHERTVLRCRDVVCAITAPSLKRFVHNVFCIPCVYHYFWSCPASQKHHHHFAGGLALHSIDMAESILQNPHLTDVERDLGLVYALLHDVGKLWCYTEDGTYGDPLGHEMAALNHLHEPLQQLGTEWPDAATAMRSFLSGLWKTAGRKPIMAVGKLVQALDHVSAEQDLRQRGDTRYQPWTPRLVSEAPF